MLGKCLNEQKPSSSRGARLRFGSGGGFVVVVGCGCLAGGLGR